MFKDTDTKFESIILALIAILSLFYLRSLFENDDSKIVSRNGEKVLDDDVKMNELEHKIDNKFNSGEANEVLI